MQMPKGITKMGHQRRNSKSLGTNRYTWRTYELSSQFKRNDR